MPPDPSVPAEITIKRKRGPKSRHSGMFSGGPDSRRHVTGPYAPAVKKSFQQAIGEHVETAVAVLTACMEDNQAPWKERQAAACLVLAHAVGSPVSRVQLQEVSSTGSDSSTVDIQALRQRANQLLSIDDVIEGEYEPV
jgi:hypothetical protein